MIRKFKKLLLALVFTMTTSCTVCLVLGILGIVGAVGATIWSLGEYSSMIFTIDSVVAIDEKISEAKTEGIPTDGTEKIIQINVVKEEKGLADYEGELRIKNSTDANSYIINGTLKVKNISESVKTKVVFDDILDMVNNPEKSIVVYEDVYFTISEKGDGKVLGLSKGFIKAKGQDDRKVDCSVAKFASKIAVGVAGNESIFDTLKESYGKK